MLLCGAGSLPATEPRFGGAANGGQSAIFQVSGRLCQQRLLPQLYIGEVHGWEMMWFKVGPSESGLGVAVAPAPAVPAPRAASPRYRACHGTSLGRCLIGHRAPFRSQIGSRHLNAGLKPGTSSGSLCIHILNSKTLSNQADLNSTKATSLHAASARKLAHSVSPALGLIPDCLSQTPRSWPPMEVLSQMTDRSQRLPCCGTDNSTLQCCTTRPTGHCGTIFPTSWPAVRPRESLRPSALLSTRHRQELLEAVLAIHCHRCNHLMRPRCRAYTAISIHTAPNGCPTGHLSVPAPVHYGPCSVQEPSFSTIASRNFPREAVPAIDSCRTFNCRGSGTEFDHSGPSMVLEL
jgi:hypothetical protein